MTVAAAQHVEGLRFASNRRSTIAKALGIIMVQYDLDNERAFAVLQRLSSHENRKLFDIAQNVLHSRGLPRGAGGSRRGLGALARAGPGASASDCVAPGCRW